MRTEAMVIVGDEGPFPALVDFAERWNGWLCPSFDPQTAQVVVDTLNARMLEWFPDPNDECASRLTMDAEGVWVFDNQGGDEYTDPRGQLYAWDDEGRVSIGAYGWTWEELTEDCVATYERPFLGTLPNREG